MRGFSTKPRKRNAPRPAAKSCEAFKAWIRKRPCFLEWTGECDTLGRKPVEAAHVDYAGKGTAAAKGMGTRAADFFCIPLCPYHHDEQHGKIGPFKERGGWSSFEAKYEFNAVHTAGRYWQAWPGRVAWERKLEERA